MTKPVPIQKTTWICPHCKAEYADRDQALKCSNTPVPEPRYKKGDTVYVLARQHIEALEYLDAQLKKKPIPSGVRFFLPRTVVECIGVEKKTHLPLYFLSKSVDVCSDGEIGCDDYTDGDYWGRPAWERELLQMGQSVNVAGKAVTVCPETIAIF